MHSNTNAYPLMDGKSMNAVFGDPCPGTTKLLRLEYMFQDYFYVNVDDYDEDDEDGSVGGGEQHRDCNKVNHVKGDPCSAMETSSLVNDEALLDSTISNGVNQSTQLQSQSRAQTLNDETITATRGKTRPKIHCTTSRLFQSTFAEHERVLLKRQDPLFRLMTHDGMGINDEDEDKEQNEHQIDQFREVTLNGSMQSNSNGLSTQSAKQTPVPEASPAQLQCINSQSQNILSTPLVPPTPSPLIPLGIISSSSPSKQWRLAPTISEITLPIILPFLAVRQRGLCQLVCSSWRDIVMERGIAVVVDVNDVGLFPKHGLSYSCPAVDVSAAHSNDGGVSGGGGGGGNGGDNNYSSSNNQQRTSLFASLSNSPSAISTANLSNGNGTANNSTSSPTHNHPSRSLLRGLLTHSYSSLESLVLNDFLPLRPSIDLHPNLPFLRKLKRLDISRIPSITDDTLDLISTYIGERLEVLYMKGLRNVTNEGVVRLVQSCQNLRVLDVSLLHQLDDEAGIAIGRYLPKLEVLHGRDNYRWTNKSVDVITRNCRKLVQVTIWGCIRLTRVDFHGGQNLVDGGRIPSKLPPLPTQLVLLNLWGCHNLTDETASLMTSLPHLRSLCVSECHRLTDRFVLSISQSLPRLVHLQLRYVRRITDVSIDAIACRMTWLYSLDVSFCTKLTIRGLAQLLQTKCDSLAELRLYSCRQLDLEGRSAVNGGRGGNVGGMVGGGRRLVQALQSVRDQSILSFLDLRECQQHEPFARDDLFLSGMTELGFSEPMNGIFVKKAQWNSRVMEQLGELAAKLV